MLRSTPEYLAAHQSNLHASTPTAGLAQLMRKRRAERWNSLTSPLIRVVVAAEDSSLDHEIWSRHWQAGQRPTRVSSPPLSTDRSVQPGHVHIGCPSTLSLLHVAGRMAAGGPDRHGLGRLTYCPHGTDVDVCLAAVRSSSCGWWYCLPSQLRLVVGPTTA